MEQNFGGINTSKHIGKPGKGRKIDHIQHIPVGKDSRGNIIYKHIFHKTENL